MKTEDLIATLARQEDAMLPVQPARRFRSALPAGVAGSILLMLLLLGIRADLADAASLPPFWWKLAYTLVLAGGAWLVTQRLARPGRALQRSWLGIAVPLLAALAAALLVLALAPPAARLPLVLGSTWSRCPLLIATLSIPTFVAVMWGIRGLAPTRLAAAGAAGGLLAGALAAAAYCLHCPESQVPFWAVWYTLGMLVPAAAGALLGPRLLRW